MKKLVLFIAALACVVSASAKTLVAYYSFTNNVHRVITELQSQIGENADVIRIEPAEKGLDYSANNYALGTALLTAIRNNPDDAASYPAIDPVDINLADYDTIIIGTPLWWSQMAAPMQTFLFTYGGQMAGKNIGLIISSASSGISGVEADAHRLIPDGNFLTSLWVRSSQVSNCSSMIADWLETINYNNQESGIAEIETSQAPGVSYSNGILSVSGEFNRLSLFNIAGTRVFETSERNVDASSLTPGVYLACVTSPTSRQTLKIRIAR